MIRRLRANGADPVLGVDDVRMLREVIELTINGVSSGLKNTDVYPPREGVGWSEDVARQLSVPERFGFRAYLKTKGFDLA